MEPIKAEIDRLMTKWKAQLDESGDPRLKGGPGFEPCNCPYCEDEGVVYTLEAKKTRAWSTHRCVCTANALPEVYRLKDGTGPRSVVKERKYVPTWRDNGLAADEVFSSRLTAFWNFDENRLDLPEWEPRVVDFRRKGDAEPTKVPGQKPEPPADASLPPADEMPPRVGGRGVF